MAHSTIPEKEQLRELYEKGGLSAHQIATRYKCSDNKVNYWLKHYGIQKRSISDAVYQRHNPTGDPFQFKPPQTKEEAFLMGLGIGLYWGEGTKRNKHAVRLGNSDPALIRNFLKFLKEMYGIRENKIRYGLQVFSDMDPEKVLRFWQKELQASRSQFGKVIVTPARSLGTYRTKIKHGVLTVYFSNKKLRDVLCGEIEELSRIR